MLDRLDGELEAVDRQQATITRNLAEARRVLVREAVSVFGLKKGIGKQNQWEIAGLPLPSPQTFRGELISRISADSSLPLCTNQCCYRSYRTPLVPHHALSRRRTPILPTPIHASYRSTSHARQLPSSRHDTISR
jgi:hypothetical protein